MDFDDFFKKKNKYHKKQAQHNYYQNDSYKGRAYSSGTTSFNPMALIESLKNNKKIKFILVFIFIVVIAIIVGLVAILFPLLTSVTDYILQNGVSGLLDEAINFLNKLWNGAK